MYNVLFLVNINPSPLVLGVLAPSSQIYRTRTNKQTIKLTRRKLIKENVNERKHSINTVINILCLLPNHLLGIRLY